MKKKNKKHTWDEICYGILVTALVIFILAGFLIRIYIKNKDIKEAKADTIYYIQPGIYTFNETIQWNANLEQGKTNNLGSYNTTPKGTITLSPEFTEDASNPQHTYTIANEITFDSVGKIIKVYHDETGDTGNSSGDDTRTDTDIYDEAEGGWYMVIYGLQEQPSFQIVKVKTYTMTIKERIQVSSYVYWFVNYNTTTIAGGTQSNEAYDSGYETGYEQGVQDTINNNSGGFNGYQEGYNAGQTQGYNKGYNQAVADINADNPYTFSNLLTAVMRAPSEFFKSFWGTEILGFNLSGLISVMFTMALVFAIFSIIKRFI